MFVLWVIAMTSYSSRIEFRLMSRYRHYPIVRVDTLGFASYAEDGSGRNYLDDMLKSVSVVPWSSYRGRSADRRVKREEWPWLFFAHDGKYTVNRFYMRFLEMRYSNSVTHSLGEFIDG